MFRVGCVAVGVSVVQVFPSGLSDARSSAPWSHEENYLLLFQALARSVLSPRCQGVYDEFSAHLLALSTVLLVNPLQSTNNLI